jgi:hypothetical protein
MCQVGGWILKLLLPIIVLMPAALLNAAAGDNTLSSVPVHALIHPYCEIRSRLARPFEALFGVNGHVLDTASLTLLKQLNPAGAVPMRIGFNWQDIQPTPTQWNFNGSDQIVNAAAQGGVPMLGILAYSTLWSSSMPRDFDVTEIAPFNVGWQSGTVASAAARLPWGTDDPVAGCAKYLWNAEIEDGSTLPRATYLRPPDNGFVHGMLTLQIPPGKTVVLEAKFGFLSDSPADSRINFSIAYAKGIQLPSLFTTEKAYDGAIQTATVDLSVFAGQTLNLFLKVDSVSGHPPGDPFLQEARVLVDGIPLSMSAFLGNDPWSATNYPPKDPDQFAAYAGQLAARYPQIQAWEVWNEPNLSYFWRPAPNPEAYAALLQIAYSAIKIANPSATVLLGGLSSVAGTGYYDSILPGDFLNRIYQQGEKPFDVVAIHPYGVGDPISYLGNRIQDIREVMDAQNDAAKKIWVTEIGWYTQGPGAIDENTQAENVCRARSVFERFSSVERVYWYELQDGAASSNDPEQNYGLFHFDGTPKPAARFSH